MEDRKEMMECSEVVEDNTSKNNNEINSISNESKDQPVEVINAETKTKETFNQPNAENNKVSVGKDTSHVFLAPTFAPPISKSKDNAKNNKTLENNNDKSNNKKSEETNDEKIPENKDKNNKERTSDNASKEDDPKPPSENNEKSNPNKKPASNKPVSKRTSDFPYTEPPWGGVCERNYSITVLKDGAVKDTIGLCDRSRVTFGRSDACDVFLEHPSCSRHHAVLQYCHQPEGKRQMGFYLIDLGSTHGTVLNKEVITPEVYNRVRVGYQVKFGGSSRIYIVEGPEEDQEEEGDLDALRQRKLEYQQQKQQKTTSGNKNMQQNDEKQQEDEEEGASWGFGEDAKEETIDLKELFERKKDIEVKDPKKTLRGFFEREGLELEYDVTERTSGRSVVHVATVKLPIDLGDGGEEVIAEGSSSNKKEAVLACATDACKMIQAYDLMQNRSGEDIRELKRKRLEENDFYGSDEDTFLDRTGNIEEKRLKRKKLAGKAKKEKFETHDSLKAELLEKKDELNTCQEKLDSSNKAVKESEEGDSLDSFMLTMQNSLEPAVKTKLKRKIVELKKEIEKLERLVEKTKPALLPQLSRKTEASNTPTEDLSITKKSETSHKEKTKPVNETSNAAKPEKKSATVQSTNKVNISKQSPSKVEDKHTLENSPKTPAKKKKVYTAPTRPSVQKKEEKEEEKDVNWLPPQGQTGDGRTHLNEKFGY